MPVPKSPILGKFVNSKKKGRMTTNVKTGLFYALSFNTGLLDLFIFVLVLTMKSHP